MKDFSDFKCQWIDKREIWAKADTVREKYWPEYDPPVNIEFIIEGRLGLNIEFRNGLFKSVLSNAWLTFDRTAIIMDHHAYFNLDHLRGKINFDLGHEVGHYFLHEETYSYLRGRINSIDDFYAFRNTAPKKELRDYEYQANEFSGRLLVPVDSLSREIESHCINITQNGLIEQYRQDPEALLYQISPEIADVFDVTPENIRERAKREYIWPPDGFLQ
jgi:hypothetical protein